MKMIGKLFIKLSLVLSSLFLLSGIVYSGSPGESPDPGDDAVLCWNAAGVSRALCPSGCPCLETDKGVGGGEGGGSNTSVGGQKENIGQDGQSVGVIGDPIDVYNSSIYRWETDFSMTGKYGVPLEIRRFYSSRDTTDWNIDWKTPFGKKWWCSYDERIIFHSNGVAYIDEYGRLHYVGYNVSTSPEVWTTSSTEVPVKITVDKTDPNNHQYYLEKIDGSVRTFDVEGKLIKIDYDPITTADESVTLVYEPCQTTGPDRLKAVVHDGEDRFLLFSYVSTPTGNVTERQIEKIELCSGTHDNIVSRYEVASYEFSDAGLIEAHLGGSDSQLIWKYEYGSQQCEENLLTGELIPTSTFTTSTLLGRISCSIDNGSTYNYVSAYMTFDNYYARVMMYWNPNLATPGWDIAYYIDEYKRVFKGSNTQTDPSTTFSYYSEGKFFKLTHSDTDADLETHYYVYDWTTENVPKIVPVRIARKVPGTTDTYESLEERMCDSENSDVMDRMRVKKHIKFSEGVGTGTQWAHRLETLFNYHSTFTNKRTQVIKNVEFDANDDPTNQEITTYEYYDSSNSTPSTSPKYSRVKTITSPDNETVTFDYNSAGLVYTITDDLTNTTTYTYDSRGNVTQVESPTGNVVTKTYNFFGQVLTSTQTNHGTTTYYYSDNTNYHNTTTAIPSSSKYCPPRLVQVINPDSTKTKVVYNPLGQVLTTTDANDVTVTNTYDELGRLETVTNGENETVTYGYDLYNHLVSFKDGKNNETEYGYDDFSRMKTETDPADKVTTYYYTDETSSCGSCGNSGSGRNLVEHIARPQTGTTDKEHLFFKYNLAGKVKAVIYKDSSTAPTDTEWANSPTLEYTYDQAGRILTLTDNRLTIDGDDSYHYEYETDTGRLLKITHPEGYTQDYIYHSTNGDLVAYRDIDGQVTEYGYDSLGRLDTLTDPYGDDTLWTHYDDTQTSYTIGALQKVDRSNATFDEYLYDSDGRLDQVQYMQGQTTLSYVDLTYDDAGMITGKNMGGTYNVEYDYDDAYRLTNEIYKNSSNVEQFRRTYSYDDAGNRATMAFGGKTTSYAYGTRNEMTSNTGYARFGSVDTGAQTFTYDDRGNMTYQSGITNTWNEDNRLTRVYISEGDPKGGNHMVYYDYDSAGRRIASHGNIGDYTRYFFNGLTEEVKKVSIGTHSNTSFGIVTKLDAEGSDGGVSGFNTLNVMSIADDGDRHSNVYQCSDWASHGAGWWNTANDGWDISGKRTVSFWAKTTPASAGGVGIHVKCTDGTKMALCYKPGTGTDYKDSTDPVAFFYLGNTSSSFLNGWARVERDLQADLSVFWSGKTLSKVTGLDMGTASLDDVRFSNSLTVEHNVLGPGSIGHILRNSTFSTTTHARTDNWFHYDQVGSVVARSDDAATPALTNLYSDAWGNRMSSYTTGEWTSTWASRDGWGHNTKEYDGDAGLVYMYQRWYQPELGVFMSKDPLSKMNLSGTPARVLFNQFPSYLNNYSFVMNRPTSLIDTNGEFAHIGVGAGIGCAIGGIGSIMADLGQGSINLRGAGCGCLGGAISGALAAAFPGMGIAGSCFTSAAGNIVDRICNCGFSSFSGSNIADTVLGALSACAGGMLGADPGDAKSKITDVVASATGSVLGGTSNSISNSLNGGGSGCCK